MNYFPDPLSMTKSERDLLRTALAEYMQSEGCSCCQDVDKHEQDKARLAKLLAVPKYKDGSGYDFGKFKEKLKQ